MALRLHPDGLTVFDEWRMRPNTSLEDEQLVAQVLMEYAEQSGWQERWHNYGDPADPAVTVVQPREGLYVLVQKWTGEKEDEFTLARIVSEELPER